MVQFECMKIITPALQLCPAQCTNLFKLLKTHAGRNQKVQLGTYSSAAVFSCLQSGSIKYHANMAGQWRLVKKMHHSRVCCCCCRRWPGAVDDTKTVAAYVAQMMTCTCYVMTWGIRSMNASRVVHITERQKIRSRTQADYILLLHTYLEKVCVDRTWSCH